MKSLSDLLAPIADPTDRLRLEAFGQTYATPEHLWLARCAAFPVALTTDLLYKIWLNFRQTDTGETVDIPINAVGDILLSPLCHEIGYDLYEIYPEARAVLWQSLSPDAVASLAEFTLRYLDFCRDKVPSEAFAEAQRIWAESFQHPQKVAQLLRQLLSERKTNAGSKIMADYVLSWVKNRNQWSNQKGLATTAQRDALSDLAQVAEGIQQYEKGEITEAKATFSSIAHLLQAPRAGGFNVPIAKEIWQSLPVNAPVEKPKGKIYAVLVGIDEYGEKIGFQQLIGCVNDVISWQAILKEHSHTIEIVSLLNKQAIKENIIQTIQNAISTLSTDDTLLFAFSGHAIRTPHGLVVYDSVTAQIETYLSEIEIISIIKSIYSYNPFVVIILDTSYSGYNGWIDTNNEKHILLSATANDEIARMAEEMGLFTLALQTTLKDKNQHISYRKLIRGAYNYAKDKENTLQTPQLFGHPKALNQTFLGGNLSQVTYINELLHECNYQNIQQVISDFEIENQEETLIATLEKYSLLKGAEKLKIIRISSDMSVRQISVFQQEYLKALPYEIEIKDINLSYTESRAGLKDGLGFLATIDSSALQDAHLIVFILNRTLINSLTEHSYLSTFTRHFSIFEYKIVCSVLWEDCPWQDTFLKAYPVFSTKQPLARSLTSFETELEIKRHYEHDWQPIINKWITDLAALGFEKELKERIEKAKQTQELDLSGMGFEKLPEAVWELEELKTIDLYNNKLTELPESLTQFQSLEKLYTSKNPVTSLPLFLTDLPNLRVLKIDDAQITEFPNWLCKHPALEDISLENNQIEIIPSALKDLPKLRLFDFRGNPVINLPSNMLKSTKSKFSELVNRIRSNSVSALRPNPDITFLYLTHNDWENNKSTIINRSLTAPNNKMFNYSAYLQNTEYIFFFPHPQLNTIFVHISETVFTDNDVNRAAKLFIEYPTGTIFFLNFSNSKRLADLLYKQKHSPIIAFDGELDDYTAGNAVLYFYGPYQSIRDVSLTFQEMISLLSDLPSPKGKYILYHD